MPKQKAKPRVEILDGDDWIVVKVDGKKWFNGHSLNNDDICDLLKNFGIPAEATCGVFGRIGKKWGDSDGDESIFTPEGEDPPTYDDSDEDE